MTARHPTQSNPLRQCPSAEAIEAMAPADWAGSAGTPLILVAMVLLAALTLVLLPAVVGVATLADAHSFDPLRNLLESAARLVQPLDYLRAGAVTAAGLVLVRLERA
jgi:hypothetical protein